MMNIRHICGGTLKLDPGFPAKWIIGVGFISDYSQMAWLIRCPLKLHLPLTRCVQGQGKTSWDYTELFMSRHPELYQNPPQFKESEMNLGQNSSFVCKSLSIRNFVISLTENKPSGNASLMTDDVLFWAPPFSAYLYGGAGSSVSGGWCGTSSRMEPRTLVGGLEGGLFHIPTLPGRRRFIVKTHCFCKSSI